MGRAALRPPQRRRRVGSGVIRVRQPTDVGITCCSPPPAPRGHPPARPTAPRERRKPGWSRRARGHSSTRCAGFPDWFCGVGLHHQGPVYWPRRPVRRTLTSVSQKTLVSGRDFAPIRGIRGVISARTPATEAPDELRDSEGQQISPNVLFPRTGGPCRLLPARNPAWLLIGSLVA